jgi:hypothetical protein
MVATANSNSQLVFKVNEYGNENIYFTGERAII